MPTHNREPLIHDAPRQKVYVKNTWASQWEHVPYLYCDAFEKVAAPSISQAQLSYRFGPLMHPGTAQFAYYPRKALNGLYVKIEIENGERWYGIIEDVADDLAGRQAPLNSEQYSGRQSFTAFGLEYLLEKQTLAECFYYKAGETESEEPKAVRVERFLPVNPENRQKNQGNMSPEFGSKNTYLFARDLDEAEFWSTGYLVQYLVAYHMPREINGSQVLPWNITHNSSLAMRFLDKPRLTPHLRTLKNLLDQLLDRRRLVSYTVDVSPNETEINLRVFSFLEEQIELLEGEILPPNPESYAISLDQSPNFDRVAIRESVSNVYDQVEVRGARILSCFTISALDGTLVKQWSDEQEEKYQTAASEQPDYEGADVVEKELRNRNWRAENQEVYRVYRYFGIPDDWDGMVRDGEGGGEEEVEHPWLPKENDEEAPRPIYLPGAQIERFLPLRASHDYTGEKIKDDAVTSSVPESQKWEYLPILVAAKFPNEDQFYSGGPYYADLSGGFGETIGNEMAPRFTAHVRTQEEGPGLVIDVHCPIGRHVIAKEDFEPLEGVDQDPADYGAIDWNDNLLATVAMRADDQVREVYPKTEDIEPADFARVLVIDLGEESQLHYVAPGTVVAIKDGQLQRSESGGYIRDDRKEMKAIAKLASDWYRKPRRALTLSARGVLTGYKVGDLITNVDGLAVGTCITRIRWTFPEQTGDRPPPPQTEIETAFAELDGRAFLAR